MDTNYVLKAHSPECEAMPMAHTFPIRRKVGLREGAAGEVTRSQAQERQFNP